MKIENIKVLVNEFTVSSNLCQCSDDLPLAWQLFRINESRRRLQVCMHGDHLMPPPLSTFNRIISSLRSNFDGPTRYVFLSVSIFSGFCLHHMFAEYVGSRAETYGPSMLPTLAAQNDMVWIASKYRHGRGVEVGDMVSFGHPCVPGEVAIKRVAGMPGDFVMRDVYQEGIDTMLQV